MKYISICSGICAATAAWKPLGWTPLAFSEIAEAPSRVLAHHYPEVPNVGDFTAPGAFDGIGRPDLVVGGTPCQSFSVSGKRAGLDDPRGVLALEFLRLVARLRPRWVIWENVCGVLSHDRGRTFGTILGLLGQCGYGFAYRVLNARHFGVSSSRRRIFIVGHSGTAWQRAASVLFERESLHGNLAPSEVSSDRSYLPCLTKNGYGSLREEEGYIAEEDGGIRRLIPEELEGAMGFRRGYTSAAGSVSSRAAVIGNSMAVPVMKWLGQRIAMLEPET